MKITKVGFSKILKDNDENYMDFIINSIKHSDPEALVTFDKRDNELRVFITPSVEEFKQEVINDVLGAHKLLHIKTNFSKSLKISKIISYTVVF